MPRKVFVAGEILTAADVNTNLMDQAVMVFDDATDRATAIPTPVEGMVTYLKDTNQVSAFTGSAFTAVGGILQVVSTTKTDTFSASLTAGASEAVTGLSVSITPSSATSKVFVMASVSLSHETTLRPAFALKRDSTQIGVGAAAGSRTVSSASGQQTSESGVLTHSQDVLDSPASTSAVTYSVDVVNVSGVSRTLFVNRAEADSNAVGQTRTASTITVMEVAG